MSTEDKSSEERDILYELFIYSEWVQEPKLVTKFGYDDDSLIGRSRGSGLTTWFTPTTSVCPPIIWHRSSFAPWQLSLSSDYRLCAILKNNETVEIRSCGKEGVAFSSVVATCHLTPECETQFRCLSWSPDSTLLAVGSPSGRVEMFDLAGGLQYSLENENPLASLEGAGGGHALVDMLWIRTDNTIGTQWSYELLLVSYNGQVQSYLVNSESYSPSFKFDIPLWSGSSIGSVAYHPKHSLLFVGEGSRRNIGEADADVPTFVADEAGLSAWKLLSEEPYLKKAATMHQDTHQNGIFPSVLSFFRAGCKDAVICLAISPSGEQLVCLHSSSTVSLWSLPGLILTRVWRSSELPAFEATNPYLPESESQLHQKVRGFWDIITVHWWSEQAIVIVRRAGSICVMSLESGRNLLGENPEWFGLAPRLAAMDTQGFLALECEWQMGLSKTRANSSFIGSELENSFLKDDTDNEDSHNDTPNPSWLRRLLAFGPLRKILEYVADMDFGDDAKPRRVVKIYRLLGVKATSPRELFAVKIENGEFDEALSLANRYDLDPDPVFQRQWRRSLLSKANIDSFLHRVSNRNWVLNECLTQVPSDAVSCRELLLYGIRITSVFSVAGIRRDVPDHDFTAEEAMRKKILRDELQPERLSQDQKWMLECRRKFLAYLDALRLYESFNNTFSSNEFAWFREQSSLSAAIYYAREGKPDPIFELLTQYSEKLAHHWLALLTQFPETVSPEIYAKLLPYASSKPPHSIRKWHQSHNRSEPDWSEGLVPCPFAEEWEAMERDFYEEEPDIVQWRCPPGKQPDFDMVLQWYLSRATIIEEYTMLTENALHLVRLAHKKLHPRGDFEEQLIKLTNDLITVKMMAFDCGMETVRLHDIQGKSFTEQLRLIMANATDASYVACFREWLLPFAERCERSCRGAKLELLKGHLTEQAAHHLDRVLRVWSFLAIEDSADATGNVVDLAHQVEVCIACVQASREHGQLPLCRRLLSLLPPRPTTATHWINLLYDQRDELCTRIDTAQFFNEYGTGMNLAEMTEISQNSDAIHGLLDKMFYRLSKKSPPFGRQEWVRLAHTIQGPLKNIMPALDIDRCFELMCLALIGSTKRENIYIATGILHLKPTDLSQETNEMSIFPYRLSPTVSQRLVLRAARDYVDSAKFHGDHCVALAKLCLSLLGEGAEQNLDQDVALEVQKELGLIQTLPLLNKLGIDMLPAQVRLHDKMRLVRKALVSKKTNYKSFDKINQLAKYLGMYDMDGSTAEGTILSMVAEVAQQEGDLEIALTLCRRIVRDGHITGWKACARLARCNDCKNFDERQQLIDFCVVHAPPQHLQKLLEQKNNIQLQEYYDSLEQKFGYSKELNARQEISFASLPSDAVDTAKQIVNRVLPIVAQTVKGAVKVVGPSILQESSSRRNKKSSTERGKFTKWSAPAFYWGIWGEEALASRLNADFTSLRYTGSSIEDLKSSTVQPQLSTLMHFSAVGDIINGTKSVMSINDDMLLTLASEYLEDDVLLALAHLLQLWDVRRVEEHFFQQLPYTRHCLRLGQYVFALATITREFQDGYVEAEVYMRMTRDELVRRVESLECHSEDVESLRELVRKFCQLEADLCQAELVQQKSGNNVDVGRFSSDEQYKRDSILGMVVCDNWESLRVALNLARHYEMSPFEVCARHLEYLFESATHATVIEARLQQEGIESYLMEDPEALWHTLRQKIYAVLSGTSYDHLRIYYRLLLACSQGNAYKKKIEAYMLLLKTVDEKLDGVDFKRLISEKSEEQRASLLEVIDETNIDEIVKLCGRFKSLLQINRSTVLQLYLKNEFVAAGYQPRSELKDLFKKHLRHIRYLTPDDVFDFIMGVCFHPSVAARNLDRSYRLEILKSFLAFTKSMAKKAAESSTLSPTSTDVPTVSSGAAVYTNASVINSWTELQARLTTFLQHLQKIEDGFVNELLDIEENPRLDAYVEKFEMTAGEKDKLEELLTDCALSECDPSLLECLLSICPEAAIKCSPVDIFLRATRLTIERLMKEATASSPNAADDEQNPDSCPFEQEYIPIAFQTRKPISVMRRLLKSSAKLSGDRSSFDKSVVELVRPFCLDKEVVLSSRLEVLRLLKECSCAIRPEDEALRLHLETLALVQERWSDIRVAPKETETTVGRQAVFRRLLDAAENAEEFDTLASLLKLWPVFDESAQSPWILLLSKMPTVEDVLGASFLSLVRIARQHRSFTVDEILQLEETWADRLTPAQRALYLLEWDEPTLHKKALNIVNDLPAEEVSAEVQDRLLELQLTPHFASGPHYRGLLDRLVQRDDFQAIASPTIDALLTAGMTSEAASLAVLTNGLPSALQSFTNALSFLTWTRTDQAVSGHEEVFSSLWKNSKQP